LRSRLPTQPVLVGREREIKQLTKHLDSAIDGKGATVFVCGEAGVGKTRLVNDFLDHAKKNGAKTLSGWCLSEAAIPYFPFTEAFNTYMSTLSDEKAKSTIQKHLGIMGWLRGPERAQEESASVSESLVFLTTPEIERDRTFEAVARVLLQLSAENLTILFLDDLHWADHLSLALLHYLARKCRDSHLLIIGTYRPEELIQTSAGRHHPLEETMFSMSREDLLTKLELNPLKRKDFPELLRSVFNSVIDEKFVEKLYEETEGNPLFALETLNLLVDEGFLSEEEDRWALTSPMEQIRIPSKVHEVIIRRIRRLGREERNLLNLAAVCGHSFNPDTLSRTIESDIIDVLQSLYEIEQRHRLIRHEDSTFEFTHHKIREVIYSNLPGELRRVYHVKTAGCLEQILAKKISDGYMADIAHHYVEGGAPEKAFEYLLRLGEEAVNIFANVQAIDYLSKALEATQKDTTLGTKENLGRIYGLRGRAWMGQGEAVKASDDFNLFLQIATSLSDESMMAEAHFWVGGARQMSWDYDEAVPHYAKALEMARKTGNKFIECRSLCDLIGPRMGSIDTFHESVTLFEESLSVSKEIGDKYVEAVNPFWVGVYHNWRGEFDLAELKLNRALALTEESGNNFWKLFTIFLLGMVNAGKGEYNEAISTLQNCIQLSQDNGVLYFVPRALNALGWIYHDLSDVELAFQYNNKALETADEYFDLPPVLINLGTDYFYKKDYENARKYFQEAKGASRYQQCAQWRYEIKMYCGLGGISLVEGDYAEALKLADDALAISEKAGAKKHTVKSRKLKAEVLGEMGNTGEAVDLMRDALKGARQVGNPPLIWQIHHSLGRLLEEQGNLLEAEEHYAEALTLIEATASKIDDVSLRNALMTAPETREIREACSKSELK
jgi:tetratricopeptide (TPR) repeat protein